MSAKLNPAMNPDDKPSPQPYAPQYIDKALHRAFTAHTATEAMAAASNLNDLAAQCHRHSLFVASTYQMHRLCAEQWCYDCVDEEYTDLMVFLSSIGTVCADVAEQLGHVYGPGDLPAMSS